MIKKTYKQIELEEYLCDICNEKIVQDGKNISLIGTPLGTYQFHLHTTCLVEHLKKTFVPN